MKTKCLLLFLMVQIIYAQGKLSEKNIDSLLTTLTSIEEGEPKIQIYNKLFIYYSSKDIEKAELFAKDGLALATKLQRDDDIAIGLRNIGKLEVDKGNYDSAIKIYTTALQKSKTIKTKGQILGSFARVYFLLNDYPKSIEYANSSLKMFEIINDKQLQSVTLLSKGNTYIIMGDTENAKIYFQKSKAVLAKDYNPIKEMENKKTDTVNICIIKQKYKGAKSYLKDIKNAIINKNDVAKLKLQVQQSALLVQRKNFNKALEIIEYSFEPIVSSNDTWLTIMLYNIKGDALLQKSKTIRESATKNKLLEESLVNFQEAFLIQKQHKNKTNLADNYEKISEVYEERGNHKQALKNYKSFIKSRDSILNSKINESIRTIESNREIELRDKQIQINSIALKAKEKQKLFLISGLFLLGIIGSLLLYQNKNRKKTNQQLQILNNNLDQANKTKIQVLNILNHDLRSPVSSFIHFIQFQKENPKALDEETKSRIENATLSSAKNLLHAMEDILIWTKDQMENFEPQFKNVKVSTLFNDSKKYFIKDDDILLTFENPDNLEIISDENYLKTIIRNLSGNAIKALASFVPEHNNDHPSVKWKVYQENNKTILSITDNGCGIAEENLKVLFDQKEVVGIQSGLGLHLIRDLAKAINCTIEVQSVLNHGTTFKIII